VHQPISVAPLRVKFPRTAGFGVRPICRLQKLSRLSRIRNFVPQVPAKAKSLRIWPPPLHPPALIAVAAIAAFTLVGTNLSTTFSTIAGQL
jgi:hypothetical protein